MLYLLSMIQNYTFQLLLCQKKIIKILLNNKIKVFKDLFIGTNIKQKNKLRTRMLMLLSILIKILLFKVLIDYFLWHIVEQIIIKLLEMVNKNIICQELTYINVIIDGCNFYDNPIESDIEKYRELKKVKI